MVADSAQKRASDSKSFTDKETAKADGEANALKLKDVTNLCRGGAEGRAFGHGSNLRRGDIQAISLVPC